MDPITHELVQRVVQQQMLKEPTAVDPKPAFELGLPKSPNLNPAMSPEKLHTLGALADMTGTYFGLHNHKASEANPMLQHGGALGAGLGLVAQLGVTKGITGLTRKFISPKLADAIAANLGSQQMALGSNWASRFAGGESHAISGPRTYDTRLLSGLQQSKTQQPYAFKD